MATNNNDKTLNVPHLRFPEFTGEWGNYKLQDICNLLSGGTPALDNPNYWNGSIPFISAATMHNSYIVDSEQYLSEEGLARGSKLLQQGNLLLLVRGSMLWKHIPICYNKLDVAFNQDVKGIITNKFSRPLFLLYWFESHESRMKYMVTGTGIGAGKLDTGNLLSMNVSLPSLKEQERIISLLQLLDERIATQNKIIEKYESLIQAMCDTLIESEQHKVELSFSDFGEPYAGLSGKSAEDFGEGCPYITYMNVYQNRIIDTANVGLVKINETEQQSVVHYGDILFTLSSETPEEVGMGAVYLGETYPLYLNSFCFGIHIIDESRIFPPFLAYYISTQSFRKTVFPLAQGSTRFNLQKSDFMKESFPFPIVERQIKIYSILKVYSDKLSVEKRMVKLLCEQKNYLLHQLFI